MFKQFLIVLLLVSYAINSYGTAVAGSATFGWKANTETDLAGYKIHYGPAPRTYNQIVDCGNVTTFTVDGVPDGMTYYAATAYDTAGNESDFSNEVAYDPPPMAPAGYVVEKATLTFEFAPVK